MNGLNGTRSAGLKPVAAPRLGHGAALWQLCRNTGKIAGHSARTMLTDHAALSRNSLVLSSLILVVSRIFVAHLSAYKAKGTPEGPYRYREAVRTTLREALGWSFSFGVLRAVEWLVKKGLNRYFGIDSAKSAFRHWREALQNAWRRTPHEFVSPYSDPARIPKFEFRNHARFERQLRPLIKNIPGMRHWGSTQMVRSLVRWTPPLIGAIPSILLSGYILEKMTRDYSDDVVNWISRQLGKPIDPSAQAKTASPKSTTGLVKAMGIDYLNHVHRKRLNRGLSANTPHPFRLS